MANKPIRPVSRDDALRVARFGEFQVTKEHIVFGDDDGCVFVDAARRG